MNIIRVFILVTLVKLICAKDDHTINFIRDFIENERKPTHLILNDLCWPKHIKVKLTKKLSKDGCRVSSSTNTLHECQKHGIMFLLDLDCPQSEDAIEIASSRNLFGSPYRWLILSTNPEQLESSVLWESPVLPDSDLVLAEKSENGYKLTELHKTSKNMSMISSPRGYYNGTLVDVRTHREIFRRRRNLMGAPLTMSNVIQDSNKTMYHLPREDRLDLQNDVIAKTSWMNARLAFQMLNATARYIFSHRWGYKQNGQWSGMINDLHTGRADVGTNCLGTMTDRFEVILYTDTLARYRVAFILRQPPLSYVSNIFSLPFSTSVWIAIALCSCLSMFALYFTSKWEVRKGKLYNDSLHMAVYKKIKPEKSNGLLYEMNEGVEKIRQGLFAFHSITEPVYRRIEQTFLEGEKCDLVEIDYLNAFDPFTPVKKDSPYLELMRVVFKQLAESGIRTAIHKRMFIPKPHCSTKMAAFSSVGMMDLKPVLLLMVYGAVLSLAILVLEMVHYRLYTTRKRERKTKKSKYIY
ncbi:uncharacterized protein LOC113521876 isoform X2 [Galleria mellonella]|uniref:Uncharacterized protein LOC113521876 isoform X2 n=1 Tax=Galleria mellonella TaxID=7137 RepID=A0ABM3MX32_GALME|nr:uncharacterized protein LOC113521876 isoform X2 [Galleria mellonella]